MRRVIAVVEGQTERSFVDSVLVLADADRLLDNDMLRRFQAIAIDERGGDRFFSAVIARLGEVAEDMADR